MVSFKISKTVFKFDWFFFIAAGVLLVFFTKIAIALSIAVAVHELTHLFFIKLFGFTVGEIHFHVFGIVISPNCRFSPTPEHQYYLIYLSAALVNLILSVIFRDNHIFSLCNLYIGLENIMPSRSFDGGAAVKVFCERHKINILWLFAIITDTVLICYMLFNGFNIILTLIAIIITADNFIE